MAALALYRPGSLSGGLKDAFVRRFKGEERVRHLHPSLAPLLDETFGVILYQEQVLRIAHELAGFSLAEADLLRRAMSHFDPGKKMQELERKFVTQAQEKSGVPLETGKRVWEMMVAFAGYGFPKAHAEIGVAQEDVEVFHQDLLGVVLEISKAVGDYRLRGGERIHVAGLPVSPRAFHDICHMTRDRKICIVGIPALEK